MQQSNEFLSQQTHSDIRQNDLLYLGNEESQQRERSVAQFNKQSQQSERLKVQVKEQSQQPQRLEAQVRNIQSGQNHLRFPFPKEVVREEPFFCVQEGNSQSTQFPFQKEVQQSNEFLSQQTHSDIRQNDLLYLGNEESQQRERSVAQFNKQSQQSERLKVQVKEQSQQPQRLEAQVRNTQSRQNHLGFPFPKGLVQQQLFLVQERNSQSTQSPFQRGAAIKRIFGPTNAQ